MSEAITTEPSAEYPEPGAAENLNGILTMIDGALIFVTLMANRGDLAALALFGAVVGSITCFKFIGERHSQYRASQNAMDGNDSWEVPA